MSDPFQLVETGRSLHAGGRVADAEAIYRRALDAHPGYPEALYLLGLAAHHRGANGDALGFLHRAAAGNPIVPDYHYTTGVVHRHLGRSAEAEAAYRRAIVIEPAHADALCSLAHLVVGRSDEAGGVLYRRALAVRPDMEAARGSLVSTLYRLRRLDEAIALLSAGGRDTQARCNLGVLLKQVGRLDEAMEVYRDIVRRDPTDPRGACGVADILLARYATAEAAVWARLAVEIAPGDVRAQEAMGRVHEQAGRPGDAVPFYRNAIALEPGRAHLNFNLGMMFERGDRMAETLDPYDRALVLDPGLTESYEKIPFRQTLCDWRRYDTDVARMVGLVHRGGKVPALPLLYVPSLPAEHRVNAARVVREELAKTAAQRAGVRFDHDRSPRDRLTIGYVSGDFREHAVAFLIAELFELHDRSRFRIHAYCAGPDRQGQALRARIEAAFDRMTLIRDLGPVEAARRIHEDRVDILVDLSGHTRYSRHDVFSLRPAPIQVNYLGYPGTIGADFIDYVLADPIVAPLEHEPFFAEKLALLPFCYQANDRKRVISDHRPTRAEVGLPDDAFVFCSFNNAAKLTPGVFAVWMRLLHALPRAVLWLLAPDPVAQANLSRAVATHGVPADRVIFAPRALPADHMARMTLADLFLDTAPYNAHTTGSDALRVGLPMVTFLGTGFAGRVGASLLHAVGLPELVADSITGYESLALALAREPDRLAALRTRLAANRGTCPLFDAPRHARHVERAYERMWQTWTAGEPPRSFRVDPAPPTIAG